MNKIELITERLADHILPAMKTADSIYILTSFAMKSGVEVIADGLKEAAERGADIKICTSDYLYITQPAALEALIEIHPEIEVRLWNSNGNSFHPKAYIFQSNEHGTLIVGSSNLSRSALTSGVEWNLAIDDQIGQEAYDQAVDIFLKEIFYSPQTVSVNKETIKTYKNRYEEHHQKHPNIVHTWTKREEIELMLPDVSNDEIKKEQDLIKEEKEPYGEIKPRFAQIEALENLETTYEEGYDKALVVMATGLGKTYLAAFFAKKFQRILFIAHREEILFQAMESFQKVIPDKKAGVYYGKEKDPQADCIFASVFTLSRKQHLEVFRPDDFDLIVIDEFHHAAAKTYQRVLDHFKPEFLLGITATPDRNDNKDIYAICDGNVAYRIDFLEAVQRKWLSPFTYYGVYDDTDYSKITWLGTRYDEEELTRAQLRTETAEKILSAWKKYKQSRTLVFCSSIRQAEFLSDFFNKKGYKTVALHSKQEKIGRKTAIRMLEAKKIDAIFTVDLFNEGVDIPSVDTLLFVRPTESLTVFVQQVGRGLRLHPEKEKCVIIDLIGNYRNADVKLSLFDTQRDIRRQRKIIPQVPETCEINLDLKVINLLKEMANKRFPAERKLFDDYFSLKEKLGRRPTYLELHLKGGSDSRTYAKKFGSYIGFLKAAGELSKKEVEVYHRYESWLKEVEDTRSKMNKKVIK